MKKNKLLISFSIGLIVGVTVQYIAQLVIKLLNKTPLKDAVRVSGSWINYYTAGIAGGINGFLLPFIPSSLYSFSSVLVAVAVYNSLLYFSSEEELVNSIQSNLSFTVGIIRDVFLITFIIYVIRLIIPANTSKESNFSSLLETSIATSIVISISFNLTQTGINNILRLTNPLNVAITE